MAPAPGGGRFSSLLLEGLDEYRRGNMAAAVRAWEEAYTLEPTNPRAREFLHSALERIYAQMGVQKRLPENNGTVGRIEPQPAPTPTQQPRLHVPARGRPEPQQPAPAPVNDATNLLTGARELQQQKDYAGALELLDKVMERERNNTAAAQLRAEVEEQLTAQLEQKLGKLSQRPKVLLKPDEIRWLDLDPRAGFVLAQIDGDVSYEDLYDICGLPRLDTVRILAQLVEEKVIGQP